MVRVDVGPHTTFADLYRQVGSELGLGDQFVLFFRGTPLSHAPKPLSTLPIQNGELFTLSSTAADTAPSQQELDETLDEVDVALAKESGLVQRKRVPLLCQHGDGQQCIHCCPLEPYDDAVQKDPDHPIKYMSFHTYLRKLNSGADRGKFTNLESINCRIDASCTAHAPWPRGICTKCQPSAVVLQRQPFRHVDYVQFENRDTVGEFIDAWRKTGKQRAAWLYGRYDKYELVPLGIKAVVVAFYEPPQLDEADGLQLLDDPALGAVDNVALGLGLQRVGWIFTDLVPDGKTGGSVQCTRFIDDGTRSALFSATEILMAARLQRALPNKVSRKFSRAGAFGSKFVSVVVTGMADGSVGMRAYQVTDQAMALERDDVILPSSKGPGFMFARDSTSERFVPEISFVNKDKYNNEIKSRAQPCFPVEYLLVDCECGTSATGQAPTLAGLATPFVPANRASFGQGQSAALLYRQVHERSERFLQRVSDFNLLVYLATDPAFASLRQSALPSLLAAVRTKDADLAETVRSSDQWKSFILTLAAERSQGSARAGSSAPSSGAAAAAASGGHRWNCSACTFLNEPARSTCDICGTPKR